MNFQYSDHSQFDFTDVISQSLKSVMSFIFERSVSVSISTDPATTNVAGVTYGKCTGSFAAGPQLHGNLSFEYTDDPSASQYTVDAISITMPGLGWSSLPFTSEASLYDAMLNKHKLFVTASETKPVRMRRIVELCGKLKELDIPQVSEIADQIIKET